MKRIITFLIVSAVIYSSCTRDITARFNNTINNSTTITGNFTLTKYTVGNSNDDSASEFSGYVFSFNINGKVSVVKNNQTSLGKYTETYSYDGNPEKLGLYFYNKPLSYLNESWHVDLISDAAIHLSNEYTGEILEFTVQ